MRSKVFLALLAALVGTLPCAYGQDQKTEVQRRLMSQFAKTELTADLSDVKKAGSVVELHQNGLTMCSTEAKNPPTFSYKDGKISCGFGCQLAWRMALNQYGQTPENIPQRKFVSGEKFWVTDYEVRNDGVVFLFYSDPYDDVRYYVQLKFPVQKGKFPPTDEVMKTIAEVLTVDNGSDGGQQPEPAAPAAQPSGAADAAPKTIALGQTKDEVVAILGKPRRRPISERKRSTTIRT